MAALVFTGNLERHVEAPRADVRGGTVGEVLGAYFRQHPAVRGYILDDQGAVRRHILVLVDGIALRDRQSLSDALGANSTVHIFQALSGG